MTPTGQDAPATPEPTEKWHTLGQQLRVIEKAYERLSPPPVPDDSYSSQVNNLNKALEGMRETINSRIEAQEQAEEWAEEHTG